MKKLLIAFFSLFALCGLVACGNKEEEKTPAEEGNTPAQEATYKLGMGISVGTNESKDGELAQIDATVAAVVLDANGKIVACRLDAVQNKITVDGDGNVEVPTSFKTKMEKGDEYGMAAALNYGMDWNGDGKVLEWYDQAKAFEAHVVGMTATEVANMATKEVPGKGYIISADEALLAAGCTIQITEFKNAVVKACNDEQGVQFTTAEAFTLGVAATSYDDGSASYTTEAGAVKVYSDFAASVVINGKIAASLNDAIQPSFAVEFDGSLEATFKGTKRELKEEYGMAPAINYGMDWNGDGKVLEWYLQSLEFSKFVVGMTKDEVLAMATQVVPGKGYVISADEALLAAGCTIQITSIKEVVAKSVTNAR